jgi:hypothetical protein
VKPDVENLVLVWNGEEFIAEAHFLGSHIRVRCRYDTYQRCWGSDVFLIEQDNSCRIAIPPWQLYATSRLGSVRRGLHRAKFSIMGVNPSSDVSEMGCGLCFALEHGGG